ncbi:uncharacterized protein MYCGRDRAFT_97641 [Zymoseptoria tritici IPO323]|uniref:Uncharacterized protein n=1 Tax=Zymoseptoria tritici (strain CBS 115943 / IPO323) TaxID=336722 RepID=F9XR34_ZYMTI|nr:uncharacterized protein MYCGRDRAFT_97641 [Zymoseptoria tritici IPO323]EGP82357.1 hypothetical protein MYCGRDRAFT_97641 [Zymoseptoria tritici IPO323]
MLLDPSATYRTARFPLVVSLFVECALSVVENSLRLSRDALEGSWEPTLKVWTAPLSEVRRRSLRKAGSLMDVVRVITNRAIRYGAGAAGAVQHPIVGSVRLEVEVWAEVAGKGFLKIELIAEDNETVGRSVRCVCIGGEKRRKQRGGHDSREDVAMSFFMPLLLTVVFIPRFGGLNRVEEGAMGGAAAKVG